MTTNDEVVGGIKEKGKGKREAHLRDDSRDYRYRLYGCSRVKPRAEYRYCRGPRAGVGKIDAKI